MQYLTSYARGATTPVALTEFASSSLHTKVHLKKILEVEKLDGKE
jgi:hypothetical protein